MSRGFFSDISYEVTLAARICTDKKHEVGKKWLAAFRPPTRLIYLLGCWAILRNSSVATWARSGRLPYLKNPLIAPFATFGLNAKALDEKVTTTASREVKCKFVGVNSMS